MIDGRKEKTKSSNFLLWTQKNTLCRYNFGVYLVSRFLDGAFWSIWLEYFTLNGMIRIFAGQVLFETLVGGKRYLIDSRLDFLEFFVGLDFGIDS